MGDYVSMWDSNPQRLAGLKAMSWE